MADAPAPSAWSPLANPVFRALWLAILVGNIGTWIHDVAATWRMADLTGSPLMVAAVQAATTLPMALLAVVAGTLVPFMCIVAALRHVPAPRVAVVATLEPALAAVFAWIFLGERLAAIQIAGGVAVLTAVGWVQSRRPDLEAESAPPHRSRARFSPR